jgi:hypothetical protein
MADRVRISMIVGTLAVLGIACTDSTKSDPNVSLASLGAALSSVPMGYGDLSTSFVGTAAANAEASGFWLGGGRGVSFDHSGLMGGGLGDAFAGGISFDRRDGGHGPFGGGLGCTGSFSASTGRVSCVDTTHNSVIVNRSAKYPTAAGTVQQAFDTSTTNTVNIQTASFGTITYDRAADVASGKDGDHHWGLGRGDGGRLLGDTSTILTAKTTVNNASDRTVTGLASGSALRTMNSKSAGTEVATGTSSLGAFSASRTVGDTTTGVTIPVVTGTRSFPTAGSVVRSISASMQYTGKAAVTLTRREVITYDGTAVAKVVITENGTTRTCSRPLPRGPLTCS